MEPTKQELLQVFENGLGVMEDLQEVCQETYGQNLYIPEELEDIKTALQTLDQDSTDNEWEHIDNVIAQGVGMAKEFAEHMAEMAQADPDASALSDTPRSPESDGATGGDLEEPYLHAFLEMLSKWVAKVKSPDADIKKPARDKGPQKIESGDNPDSYKRQSGDSIVNRELQQALETTRNLNVEHERRLVQDSVDYYVKRVPDAMHGAVARSMLQDCATMGEFNAKVDEFQSRVAPHIGGGAWVHARKGVGFLNQAKDAPVSPEGRPPANRNELVDYMIQDADSFCQRKGGARLNTVLGAAAGQEGENRVDIRALQQDASDGVILSHYGSGGYSGIFDRYAPEAGLRFLMSNLIQQRPHDADLYIAYLNQDLGTGATGVGQIDAGQPFVFPLISRVYPQLLLSRVGAVYPIDRPTASLFYWSHLGYKSTAGTIGATGCFLHQLGCYPMTMTADPGEGDEASRLQLELVEDTVQVSAHKMAAEWSTELETRLMAYQNRNPLNEHLTAMADQIARELNFRALDLMMDAADDRVVTYGTVAPGSWEQDDWNDQLHAFVQLASDDIFQARYREAAFIIGDAASVTRLMRGMKSGAFQKSSDVWTLSNGISVVGSVNNYFTVIKTALWGRDYPGATADKYKNKLLLVARGETFSDCGIVYAPFTYDVTPPWTDPSSFKKKIGVMEQAALKVIIPEMFARVEIGVGTTGTDF